MDSLFPNKNLPSFLNIVEAGEFSKTHIGEHALPQKLCHSLYHIDIEVMQEIIKDAYVLIDEIIPKTLSSGLKTSPLSKLVIQAIVSLDQLHSFFHGVGILAQIWQVYNKDALVVVLKDCIELEMHYAEQTGKLSKYGLTAKICEQAISQSRPIGIVGKLAWVDDLIRNPLTPC